MYVFAKTDIGQYRKENQDAYAIQPLGEKSLLALVCDGMGGAAGGSIASQLAMSSFVGYFVSEISDKNISLNDKSDMNLGILEELLKDSLRVANREVFMRSQTDVNLQGMGTTLVACLVLDSVCLIINVGDSRLYHFHSVGLDQITRDHSYVQMLVDTGRLSPELASTHPERNVITRAVGVRQGVTGETFRLTVSKGEKILLCSDGLSGYVSTEEMKSVVSCDDIDNGIDFADSLVQIANRNGGKDNITAVLLTF